MKVLMTADAVGGVWTYALDLCAALHSHDVNVVLATMGPRPSQMQRTAARSLTNVQLVESDYRLEWMDDPWNEVSAAGDWLLGLASRESVDLVHLNGYAHAALSWSRPVVCAAHSCVTTWWQAVHGAQPPSRWDEYRRNVTRGLNSADSVVAPTRAFLDQLRTCYEFSRPARVIHNGRMITGQTHQRLGETQDADGFSGSSHERAPVILACGRPWDVAKNMAMLDAAARGAKWTAHVIGGVTGPDGQSFVPASLHCLGTLPSSQVDHWLERASILVHPALYEPFGLAVLEAARSGCALVLADIPTLRELWNGAAAFFDPRDSRKLRAVLNRLVVDSEWRRSLAAAAQARSSDYRIETAAAEYAKLYEALTGRQTNCGRAVA